MATVPIGYYVEWRWMPIQAYDVKYIGPRTLITTFEDETEIRRRKSSGVRREFTERHKVSDSEMLEIITLYRDKGTSKTFTKLSFDAFDPVETVVTVRFVSEPKYQRIPGNRCEFTAKFLEVL